MRHLRFFLLTLMASTIMSAFAQNEDITVSGTVVDNNGEPVIGASVIQKGTSNGAVTDLDGHFSVKVPQGYNPYNLLYRLLHARREGRSKSSNQISRKF